MELAREEGKACKQLELTLLGNETIDIKPGQGNRLLGAQTLISAFFFGRDSRAWQGPGVPVESRGPQELWVPQ